MKLSDKRGYIRVDGGAEALRVLPDITKKPAGQDCEFTGFLPFN